ncbi:MAG: carbamoyl-phosphate synthase large subunit [Clostridia bacterium]|nr:carbamoyl-phosphate synthase large subunit [Clostridia bacterium]
MPINKDIKKVMVIGSGPIVIGQAAEFDYAGTQACRVLKDAGLDVVLVNSNPATIMTDKALADEIYLEPLTAETVKRIIEKEKPDSLLAGLGGQTGLTIAMQLSKDGYLDRMGVKLLGTNAEAIDKAEDRKMFRDTMESINQPVIPSEIANDVDTALEIAEKIGYPIIIRPAFTLGGGGGGVANNAEELAVIAKTGLDLSPITQVLVEKYIFGWKEIEFETMRDSAGNCIAVCSMENFDPVGIHTGDSIVAAPALSLTDEEFQMLRKASLDIVDALGIIGGCNCQFALDPNSMDYAVIEVNPRVSRSSALASKATGYPIAKVTAMLALGITLDEIKNEETGLNCEKFEPDVKYIVVKLPKWPFDKFVNASRQLGTQMKATGEVMSIGPTFENAIMKAVRGAEISLDTLNSAPKTKAPLIDRLKNTDDMRLFSVFEAIKSGMSIEEIHDITKITEWFLLKLKNLADYEKAIENGNMTVELYNQGKLYGYTDAALKRLSGVSELPAHKEASYKIVDTCSSNFPVAAPYFYSVYDEECEARPFLEKSDKERIIVLGSGPIRIGQGIEFDYSSVHCVWTLKELGYEVAIINNNPETVSTDYDTADRLYFEPLTPEDVMNIIKVEKPIGVVVAFGGQTAIKLTKFLDENGITILGTSADGIDTAEDRERFDALLEKFAIRRPKGMGVMTKQEALNAANTLGYPVLLRPSYVIGGQNMTIAHEDADVERYMDIILSGEIENPVLVDKYMMGTELEVDVISDGKDVLIPGIMEHVERAGVHSGDSIAVYPPYNLNDKMRENICDVSEKLALSLGTKGLVNIQYLIYHNQLYVIEVNPRASRTIPYISKVTGVPMVDIASKVMVGQSLKDLGYGTGLYKTPPYYTVKVPVFSFEKLSDVNSILGPEMKSTGEVLGIGKTTAEALYKGLTSAGFKIQLPTAEKNIGILLSVDSHDMLDAVSLAKKLDDLKINIYATKETADAISQLGIDVEYVNSRYDDNSEIYKLLESGKIDYVVYTGALQDSTMGDYIALHRRAIQLSIACITSLDTANALADIIASRFNQQNTELVDINNMRSERQTLNFVKMDASGNDHIVIENFDNSITCPESLCVSLCDRNHGVGSDGVVLVEKSDVAQVKMRVFNLDGSEGRMGGNAMRSVAKYVYDKGYVDTETVTIETASGVKSVELYTMNGKVSSVCANMGKADLENAVTSTIDTNKFIDYPVSINGEEQRITCVSMGNPHCVIFVPRVDTIEIEKVGPKFEKADIFAHRVNTEFVRVVNETTLKMRVWERGNGETLACGTGACAAVVAAVENGFCKKNTDITVKVRGGDLIVNYSDEGVYLTGSTKLVFEGSLEY